MKAFLFLALCASFVSPALAQTADPPLVKKATADLNGDGKPDTITAISTANNKQFILTVNGIKRTVSHGDFFDGFPGFRLLRLSGDSKRQHIAVALYGPNDYNEHYFFTFDGTVIRPAGILPGNYNAPGNGSVYVNQWLGFWSCQTKYAVTPSGTLQYVPQAGYYVGKSATAKATFPIRVSPTKSSAVVANVAPATKIEVILFQPYGKEPTTPEGGYYLIKTQTGLCGWAEFKVFQNKVDGLPFAG